MYIPIQEFLSCSLNTSGHALTCTSLCLLWLYEQVIVCVMDVYMQYLPTKSTQACTPCAVFFKIKLSKADSITYTLLSLESILSPSPGLES